VLDSTQSKQFKTFDWTDLSSISRCEVPIHWHEWLADSGSLTERLIDASNGQLSVNIISQTDMLPSYSEADILNANYKVPMFIRQVVLSGQKIPWIFARSAIPLTTLTGKQSSLRDINSKPLGAVLFSDPSMTRAPVQVAHLSAQSFFIPANICPKDELVWARRSVFFLEEKPLLVAEIFLPTFRPYNQCLD
jgi:chorismate--pyruvate lyase